jgi:hypothetical protein
MMLLGSKGSFEIQATNLISSTPMLFSFKILLIASISKSILHHSEIEPSALVKTSTSNFKSDVVISALKFSLLIVIFSDLKTYLVLD